MILEYEKDGYLISTDKDKLDLNVIHDFLANESYWSKNIPREFVEKSVQNSICYGIYHDESLACFGRIITDYTLLAYVADVFVIKSYRGKGLSKLLMESMLANPELKNIRAWRLVTKDAQGLYVKFGFKHVEEPENFMEIKRKDLY